MKKYIIPEFDDIELVNAVIMNTTVDPDKPLDDQILSGYAETEQQDDL